MMAMDCADYIVDTAINKGVAITNLQVQKILFLICAMYNYENGKLPFDDEKFEAWDYGPVVRSVYDKYKIYFSGRNCIFLLYFFNEMGGMVTMMAMDCADYIVDTAINKGVAITNLQVQKILFLICAMYNYENGKLPFDDEKFEAWDYGPVVRSVYDKYKIYFSDGIKSCDNLYLENGEIKCKRYNKENLDGKFKVLVRQYLLKLLECKIFKIVDYTHGLPFWVGNTARIQRREKVIYPNEAIKISPNTIKKSIPNWK